MHESPQGFTLYHQVENEMSDSYAIYFSSEDCTHIAPIKTLTTLLKQQIIFFLLLCLSHGHYILLDYFASDHTLPKIAKGSIDPLTVLKGSHPQAISIISVMCQNDIPYTSIVCQA